MKTIKRKRIWEMMKIQLKNNLCIVCKGPLPKNYEFQCCCVDHFCGCVGMSVEPWTCCEICEELSWLDDPYREYYHMWR